MSRFAERGRGVTLEVLDLSSLEAQALELRRRTNPDCTAARIHGGEWGIHQAKHGRLYAICTEGVGHVVTDEEPLELEFYGDYACRDENGNVDEHRTMFDIAPFASGLLIPEELKNDYPVKETVDLADFVRRFGDRLENNFWLWYGELALQELV